METNADSITATLGIFSGRENPELRLDEKIFEEFAEKVKATIGKNPIHPPPPPKLGTYFGFLVKTPKDLAQHLEIPLEFSVFHGVITNRTTREQTHWQDVTKLEQFLLNLAFEQGHGDLLIKLGIKNPK